MPRPVTTPGRIVTAAVVALLATVVGFPAVVPASAHGELLFSDPSDGGVLEALPSRAFLTFSDSITEIREITIVGPDGSVTNGAPTSVGPEVRQTLWAGPEGSYTMEYFVVSADGHDVRGDVHFEVGSAPTSAASADGEATGTPAADGWAERGRGAVVPGVVVVLAAATALVLARRRRAQA
ncbi:copper resistance protein CopC [Nocardioides KLBMP 9356]|uniref:Copper resistance protein CopC n=1 Tax=Nocardioides potassii TaxID=2911371 RepID=A0ABS9H6L2_9ACTN|nr:copper resistance CopC family protein [Nocardioides potassii]MCF6376870.1 copper resistance protein CopC [Nocardioides potassii]